MERCARFRTDGERWLARYFDEVLGWHEGEAWLYEPELPGRRRKPDFHVAAEGTALLLEVKDFGDEIEELPTTLRVLQPYRRIRNKLDAGRKQLEEYADFPCALVLRPGPTLDTDVTSAGRIMEALLGPASNPSPRLRERYAVIGAVVTLRWRRVRLEAFDVAWSFLKEARGGRSPSRGTLSRLCERLSSAELLDDGFVLGVSVHVNPHATRAFPAHVFRGPFDECFEWSDGGPVRTFRGAGLSEVVERARRVAEEFRLAS